MTKDPLKSLINILGHDYTKDTDPTTLRNKISYLSSKPFLFSGSVRLNIDPMVEFSDQKICEILDLLGGAKILYETVDVGRSHTLRGII